MILILVAFCTIVAVRGGSPTIHESDVNYRVEPGARMCFFERGEAGQLMEVFYQVIDGQHGDLDISFDVIDPSGETIVADYKKPENSIIREVEVTGDYAFCMDNSFSVMNSKLVFVYVLMENPEREGEEATVSILEEDGSERTVEEVLQWEGFDEVGDPYYVDVEKISESLALTLRRVVRARHLLGLRAAAGARDGYLAAEDTFVVDAWSAFQITFMFGVGVLQVFMIKKLFSSPSY